LVKSFCHGRYSKGATNVSGMDQQFPPLSLLDSLNIAYIMGAKLGDHQFMFDGIKDLEPETHTQQGSDMVHYKFTYIMMFR